ncbi:MAG: gamma-glutamyl-gamma-aminobutyrate hydrolase family protein [Tissierellaceae bacterium]|nr:gamma-glutamyl-gamma-aminobutyrate hydrolase family protein [Tissierellaceae bacterium]
MKPLIGLTCQFDYSQRIRFNKINYTYIDAIKKAGGIPIIFPIMSEFDAIDRYLNVVDGIILTGGGDAAPLLFGEEPIREVDSICFERDNMELKIIKRAYEMSKPMFGICRGIQMINIALGGTLYQDIYKQIPDALGHIAGSSIQGGYHTVEIVKDSIMYEIFNKERIQVNSQHHQSVRALGNNLKINALSLDGVIEGMESTNDKFVLGVQFHPEAMIDRNEEFLNIFKFFISHCNVNK